MALRFILLLLPSLAVARINIEISGVVDQDYNKMDVNYSGSDVSLISDTERDSFKLTDNNVKEGARAYFGDRPDDAYLRSPTPWGDLFQSYGWEQTKRTLKPISAKVLQITTQPTTIMQQIFENNSSKPATFNVAISQSVANTVSSKWSTSEALTVGQGISYEYDLRFANIGGKTSFSYTNIWGYDTEKAETVTMGSESAREVLLQPKQSVLAELHATRGTVQVEVTYEATLAGRAAVYFNKKFKSHYFWGLDVSGVLQGLNMKNSWVSKEIIEIGFYSNASIVVNDRQSGNKLLDVAF